MAPSECNGRCEADLETTCYCGCVDPYPNQCDDSCWTDCPNSNYPHWNCKDNGQATCCADGYPYYCDRTENCWEKSWQCDEAIECGGSWWVCGSESSVENCHNGNVYCCSSSNPYYCPQTGSCVQSSSHCCTNECSTAGSTRCINSNDEQTCGDYDSDACLEWGGDITCMNGCSGGECVSHVDIEGAFRSLEDDAPIAGRTVRLTDCSDNEVDTDVTDSDGLTLTDGFGAASWPDGGYSVVAYNQTRKRNVYFAFSVDCIYPDNMDEVITEAVDWVFKLPGDVTGDNEVDIADLAQIGMNFRETSSDEGWDPMIDMNSDGKIGIMDLAIVGMNYGRVY